MHAGVLILYLAIQMWMLVARWCLRKVKSTFLLLQSSTCTEVRLGAQISHVCIPEPSLIGCVVLGKLL